MSGTSPSIAPGYPSGGSADGGRRWVARDVQRIVAARIPERIDLAFERSLPMPGEGELLARAIAAMANELGGTIVIGIEKDPQGRALRTVPLLVELDDAARFVHRVARTEIDEPLTVDVTPVAEDRPRRRAGSLVVVVPPSERAPHFVRGIAWGRSDSGLRRLKRVELARRFAISRDFLEETGLAERMLRPARIVADVQRIGETRIVIFRNIGERTALSVRWHVVSGWAHPLEAPGERNAIDRLPPAAAHPVHGVFPPETMPAKIEVSWVDEAGPPAQTLVVVT